MKVKTENIIKQIADFKQRNKDTNQKTTITELVKFLERNYEIHYKPPGWGKLYAKEVCEDNIVSILEDYEYNPSNYNIETLIDDIVGRIDDIISDDWSSLVSDVVDAQ